MTTDVLLLLGVAAAVAFLVVSFVEGVPDAPSASEQLR